MKASEIRKMLRQRSGISYEITFRIPEMNGKKSTVWTGTPDEMIDALEKAGCTNIKVVQSL